MPLLCKSNYLTTCRSADSEARDEPTRTFLPVMEVACQIIENLTSEEIGRRQRLPLEWNGRGADGLLWRANVAAANCYAGSQESVGFHSDQLTYLGPHATIASLSLGAFFSDEKHRTEPSKAQIASSDCGRSYHAMRKTNDRRVHSTFLCRTTL